jgi:hypothetical protein
MIDDDTMSRMVGAVGGVPVCAGGDEWMRDWLSEATIRTIIQAAIRAGNLVPAPPPRAGRLAQMQEQLEYWAGQDVREEDVARDEVLAVMGRTIADLRSQFGDAANIVAHVQSALAAAGYIHQSASGDQPPRPNELADCIRNLHHDLQAARAEAADRTTYAAELEERVARLERVRDEAFRRVVELERQEKDARGERDEQAADLAVANANALTAVHNILIRNGSLALPDLVGIVQGVATELERRDERVKELEQQFSALTEAIKSRDKVSNCVAELRAHAQHSEVQTFEAEELRLLRLIARMAEWVP